MFNDHIFDSWLDKKAHDIITRMGDGQALSSEEMMVLVLKAQTNHFNHLDVELRHDMKTLREDMAADMKTLREDMAADMKTLREDMDKRFEQVDKRFEQVDKRFETLISRIDRFMIWSFATTLAVGAGVIATLKLT